MFEFPGLILSKGVDISTHRCVAVTHPYGAATDVYDGHLQILSRAKYIA